MKRFIIPVLFILSFPLAAEDIRNKPLDVSLSAALALPGVIVGSYELEFSPATTGTFVSSFSPGVKLVAEYFPRAIPWAAPSIAVHYAPLFLPEDIDLGNWGGRDHIIPKNSLHFTEVEAGVKFRAFLGEHWTLEPGTYLGYCQVFSSSPDARNNGMILDVNTELQRHFQAFHVVGTLGFMMQVYGGVKDLAYVYSFPVVYLAFGVGI
jgi:hypothetical protein